MFFEIVESELQISYSDIIKYIYLDLFSRKMQLLRVPEPQVTKSKEEHWQMPTPDFPYVLGFSLLESIPVLDGSLVSSYMAVLALFMY